MARGLTDRRRGILRRDPSILWRERRQEGCVCPGPGLSARASSSPPGPLIADANRRRRARQVLRRVHRRAFAGTAEGIPGAGGGPGCRRADLCPRARVLDLPPGAGPSSSFGSGCPTAGDRAGACRRSGASLEADGAVLSNRGGKLVPLRCSRGACCRNHLPRSRLRSKPCLI